MGIICKSENLLADATIGGYDKLFTQEPEAIFNEEVWHTSGCG